MASAHCLFLSLLYIFRQSGIKLLESCIDFTVEIIFYLLEESTEEFALRHCILPVVGKRAPSTVEAAVGIAFRSLYGCYHCLHCLSYSLGIDSFYTIVDQHHLLGYR